MSTAIIFDCEFLCTVDSQRRFWCGPYDPDPVIAQIGAVKLSLRDDFPFIETFRTFVRPMDRHGKPYALDPFFTKLTGITPAHITDEGVSLGDALTQLEDFADGAPYYSWGKDELNMLAISCYVEGIPAPIPATRFHNACDILLRAGMPYDDLKQTRSTSLHTYYGLTPDNVQDHDALSDAKCVAMTLQHLLRNGSLTAADF